MDPVGPWSAYASYNRLAAGVQPGTTGGDFHHHLASGASGLTHNPASGVPSTTSQLLLQAAHTTASLAGQLGSSTASPFNPGTFLSPPPVAYDAMFSPLFHHGNPKPAHYSSTINAQHRQALAQAQAAAVSKQASVESDLTTLRENYNQHHQSLAAAQGSGFFDQSSAQAASSALAWQSNNQLPSPFGILPHESVVPSSPGPPTTKSSSAVYENFNAHFAAAQTLNNHINSQLVAANSKNARSASPQVVNAPVKPVASQASTNSGTFYQTPASFGTSETLSSYSGTSAAKQQDYQAGKNNRNQQPGGGIVPGANNLQQSSAGPPGQQPGNDLAAKIVEKKVAVPVTSSSGFMASYLKFLQGERDTSPPPAARGARKTNWSRTTPTNTPSISPSPVVTAKPVDNLPTNGMQQQQNIVAQPITKTSEDDPRYFPLPKERKRKGFDSSDDSFDTSDDDGVLGRARMKPVLNVPTGMPSDKGKKGSRPPMVSNKPGSLPASKKSRTPNQQNAQAQPQMQPQQYYQQPGEEDDPLLLPPRRETSRRKAKERNNIAQLIDRQAAGEMDEPEEPPEFVDSDSDPAWTPQATADEDGLPAVTGMPRKKKRNRNLMPGRKGRRSNILSAAAEGAGINDFDYSSDEEEMMPMKRTGVIQQQTVPNIIQQPMQPQIIQQTINTSCPVRQPLQQVIPQQQPLQGIQQQPVQRMQQPAVQRIQQNPQTMQRTPQIMQQQQQQQQIVHQQQNIVHQQQPTMGHQGVVNNVMQNQQLQQSADHYKHDEFVVARADLTQEWPILWRVDGKSLLQKYEPFDHNGTMLYRNISTYAAWVPENRRLYVIAPVRIQKQTHHETIVEFLRNQLVLQENEQMNVTNVLAPASRVVMKDHDFIQRCMESTMVYQDNFEVYIQTLISQALDSNFLTEIFQEQDEYFLSNVKTVDDLTSDRRARLISISRIPRNLEASISTWPCFNVITELGGTQPGALCVACQQPLREAGQARVILYGQPYNQVTLEGCQPDANVHMEKDFLMCRECSNRIELLNKVVHQKYLMFIECAKRVSEKRTQDRSKDTTVILNELLADESWLSQLFRDVRSTWAEVDHMDHQWRLQQ